MNALTAVGIWLACLILMPVLAIFSEWLILIPFIGFVYMSLYLEKNEKRLLKTK